jgi:hypothetical protein
MTFIYDDSKSGLKSLSILYLRFVVYHHGYYGLIARYMYVIKKVRATSHKRLRDRDYHTSSTLVGGKHGAGPISIHTTLEGPTE